MDDIIHLLSDAVANQIAAGEVIQRPASAVKELLENSIDAEATQIQLVIKDAGRTLIQVCDDGKGMSFNDARLCFERHATSKITKADDLFAIQTKGFRGEALASVAAIAHVEIKTKRAAVEIGTRLQIEGSVVKEHAPIATQDGTIISIKNLFFNVPARRNFLKSDATEFANIEDEFNRVAIIHHQIGFTLIHNGKIILQLQPSNLKQRIVAIFGNNLKDKLYPIEQQTDFIKISGWIGKPENAKKKKSEQFLFVNHRYVRHNLLHFAIESAYNQLIPEGHHPAYFISLEVNPASIDINISPTKVDVKFQNDRLFFGVLNASVKKAIGEFSLVPQLDFDYNQELDLNNVPQNAPLKVPTIHIDPNFNPFSCNKNHPSAFSKKEARGIQNWDNFLSGIKATHVEATPIANNPVELDFDENAEDKLPSVESYLIVYQKYLVVALQNQLLVIHITRAQERILYDTYLEAIKNKPITVQQSMFPETITLSAAQSEMLLEINDEFKKLGYDFEPINHNQFAINGTPSSEDENGDIQAMIENLLDDYKSNMMSYSVERDKNLALSLSKQKRALIKPLNNVLEVNAFLQQLFATILPSITPSGEKIYEIMTEEAVNKIFG